MSTTASSAHRFQQLIDQGELLESAEITAACTGRALAQPVRALTATGVPVAYQLTWPGPGHDQAMPGLSPCFWRHLAAGSSSQTDWPRHRAADVIQPPGHPRID